MDQLTDYIQWVGGLSFEAYPFREADAMILSVIAYFDLSPVFAAASATEGAAPVRVRDCIPMLDAGQAKLRITGGDMGQTAIFDLAARSMRFGDLLMTDYVDILRQEPALQFAAVTFHLPGQYSFIAFRGTDATLAGWEEDFMIAFTQTEAQQMARDYAEQIIHRPGFGPAFYISGHSKGGNQALYAAATISDEAWSKVTKAYYLDGPGFCPDVIDLSLIDRIDGKSVRIIPEFDVIGKLFEPKITDTRIVKSNEKGFMQHSLASWLLDHGDLATVPETDPKSAWLNQTLDKWIGTISQEERPVFIHELFVALRGDGLDCLDDLDLDSFQSALIKLSQTSEVTRQTLTDLPKQIVLQEVLDDPAVKEAQEAVKQNNVFSWLRTSPLAHSLLLIVCGAAILLSSKKIVELASVLLVFSLTAVQCGLAVRRLYKNHWSLEGMRERIIISLIMLGLCVCLIVKEQAMFLLGSMIFGVICFVLSYASGEKAARLKNDRFARILHIVECVVTGIYGISFLLIPSATVSAYALSIGILMLLDGVVRLVRMFTKKEK